MLLRNSFLLCNLELTEEPRLTLNSRSSCPSLPRALITNMCYHTQQDKVLLEKGAGLSRGFETSVSNQPHPDSLRGGQWQLFTWAGDNRWHRPGSKTQPWRFTERANATEVVEDQLSEDALQFYEKLFLHRLVTS